MPQESRIMYAIYTVLCCTVSCYIVGSSFVPVQPVFPWLAKQLQNREKYVSSSSLSPEFDIYVVEETMCCER